MRFALRWLGDGCCCGCCYDCEDTMLDNCVLERWTPSSRGGDWELRERVSADLEEVGDADPSDYTDTRDKTID